MSVNSSTSSVINLCPSTVGVSVFTSLFLSYILFLLPLLIYVLYVGYQHQKKQRSTTMAAVTSHSDAFTYNMVAMELIGVLGSLIYCCGAYTDHNLLLTVGQYIFSIASPGQTLFHLLTCLGHYLAVVHPVTYLKLRQVSGVRIRNVCIGGAWLVSFGSLSMLMLDTFQVIVYIFLSLVFIFAVISFCSLSVLCVLIRPGPGNVGGNRGQVDQMKQRAFYTIMAIQGALLLRFTSMLVLYATLTLLWSGASLDFCVLTWATSWFSFPSSLVLPLLFLHRAGKLPGCKHNT